MSRTHHNPLVQLDHFSFRYEENKDPLLKNLSFTINENDAVLFIGPSGSGKSTLALCLNGLYPDVIEGRSEGEIYFKGTPLHHFEKGTINQEIAVVFQDPDSQFCMVTVEDELAFTLENIKTPRDEMKKKIDDILQLLGLTGVKYCPIHELSGGQKQKVALASVLLLRPSLLILDEPTANLDPASRFEFIQIVKQLKLERNFALLIIEHDLDDWLPVANRVLAMSSEGELLAEGTPQEIFYHQTSLLKNEGIHIPKVVETVLKIDARPATGKNLPLSEKDLATWLQRIGTPSFFTKEKKTMKTVPPIGDKCNEVLSFSNISFSRGKQTFLNEINLTFTSGELVAIVGPNGAGKSTLLQLIAGILHPKAGERFLLNKRYSSWSESEMRNALGFVFQNPEHQFITDTVFDEIAFGMVLNKTPENVLKEKVHQLLERFHLENEKWSNPFSLSGGQKRRLSVATMLDEVPRVLLFDEPTFGQDAETTEELMDIIESLRKKGTSIVFVTHDMDLVDRFCQKVYVINEGHISFEGSPDELWEKKALVERSQLRLPFRVRMQEKIVVNEKKYGVELRHDYVY